MPARVLRLSFTGELGYEVYVAESHLATLYRAVVEAGKPLDASLVGVRAILSLRMEKGFGSWMREFTPAQTAVQSGLDRFVAKKRNDFIGADPFRRELEEGPHQRLRMFEIEADKLDAIGNEPILLNGEYSGFVTSGDRGWTVSKSLALGYVKSEALLAGENGGDWVIELLGEPRKAHLLTECPVDPTGTRMRS